MCVNISSKFTKYNSQMRKNYCNKCFTETSKKKYDFIDLFKKIYEKSIEVNSVMIFIYFHIYNRVIIGILILIS